MTSPASPLPSDPTLAVAERQLAMLGELAQIALAAARAHGAAAVATAKAEQGIVSEDWFTPEVGRARACGARDAAESLQKVSRALRLTLVLEMNVAEIVRDIRSGKITYMGGIAHRKEGGEIPARSPGRALADQDGNAGSISDDRDTDRRAHDGNAERLVEFDRPDVLLHAPFRGAVDQIAEDVSALVDWRTLKVATTEPKRTESAASVPPDEPATRELADARDSP